MPALNFSTIVLDENVRKNPAQIVVADKVDVESFLREETTTSWKKGYTERSYDFPNTYVDLPVPFLESDPISTFSSQQNDRFYQRYFNKKM